MRIDVRVDTMRRHRAIITRKRVSGVSVTENVDSCSSARLLEGKGQD